MLLTTFLLLASAVTIYFSCGLFVNGIEWFGRKLNLGATATGTVLAAFGTALPESAVTFTAVVLGNTPQQKEIGIGAALGGPLVLATIAYAVVGCALFLRQRRLRTTNRAIEIGHKRLCRDQASFLLIFFFKVGLGLFAFHLKPWLGILFLAAYVAYIFREIQTSETSPEEEELEPLKFCRKSENPPAIRVGAQVAFALLVTAAASRIFVDQLDATSAFFGIAPHLAALLLSPIATELPEIMNAVIWVRQGKERLALANISGSMMIQATIPSALGIMFTPWMLDSALLAAAGMTMLAVVVLWFLFRRGPVDGRKLSAIGLLYFIFIGYLWSIKN